MCEAVFYDLRMAFRKCFVGDTGEFGGKSSFGDIFRGRRQMALKHHGLNGNMLLS